MQNHQQGNRLSWGDTVFLHLEREGMPLNVACVSVLEGEIRFKDCLQFMESKLALIPHLVKRVVAPPLNLGLPSWEYDPNFDIRNHVRKVTLKQGTDTELKALAGKIVSTVLDRQHPLWDLTFVYGLKGDGPKGEGPKGKRRRPRSRASSPSRWEWNSSVSTCRSTWNATRCPASSALRRATWVSIRAAC